MTKKVLQSAGLFLATFAAFALAVGHPHTALAAAGKTDLSRVEKLIDTEAGETALARAGVSADEFKTMLAKLTPEQRTKVETMARNASPRARLTAGMLAAGYTKEEINKRLDLLTNEEMAKLADSPDAVTAGTSVGTAVAVVLIVFIAVLVAWYFVAVEDPEAADPAPAPAK